MLVFAPLTLGLVTRVPQGDAVRCARYWPAAAAGVAFLLAVQRRAAEAAARGLLPAGAAGGFGNTLATPGQQRCDVTGHAASALLKLLPLCQQDEEAAAHAAAQEQPPVTPRQQPPQPGGTDRLRGA
jgi:hypothetical protein